MSQIFKKIRIGSRASKLALTQAEEIKNLLSQKISGSQEIEIVPITTSGDKIQDRNLADIGGKGLFVKELEEALISNKIDLAVHSAKDVPPQLHPQTDLPAFTTRLDARDCFISKKFATISDLPKGAVVGTSSARRKAILLKLRPDLQIVNFRGNVDTRLKKIEENQVDATILGLCGLERMGKKTSSQMTCPFGYQTNKAIEKEVMLPAGGQGALAIQTRKDDSEILALVAQINDLPTQICLTAERAFLEDLQASCSTPVAVNAVISEEELVLETLILDFNGEESFATKSKILIGKNSLEDAQKLGKAAAAKTKVEAKELIEKLLNS